MVGGGCKSRRRAPRSPKERSKTQNIEKSAKGRFSNERKLLGEEEEV